MNSRDRYLLLAFAAALALQARAAPGLELVTREQAVAEALEHGARFAIARTDTAAAAAMLRAARVWENPTLAAEYSKSAPQFHVALAVPIDAPWQRAPRIRAAALADSAARINVAHERAAVRFETETAYVRVLAAKARSRLSRRTAQDADSLMRMAMVRRDAGDAGELEVELAVVSAGEMANEAADDSAAAVAAVLELQILMGLTAESVAIAAADSLSPPSPSNAPPLGGTTLEVAAATSTVRALEASLTLEHRRVIGAPSILVGVETHDPSGSETGFLPMVGVALALPLFNANGAAIDLAAANRERARTALEQTQRESAAAITRAALALALALEKVQRDVRLRASADRVAAMSLVAYAEGAVALPAVLEANRTARSALARYIDDVAAASTADAALRFVSTSVSEQR